MHSRRASGRKDFNHKLLVDALEKLGACVLDLSIIGSGCPDLAVSINDEWHMAEVKNPDNQYGKRGLSPAQKEWAMAWTGGPVYILRTLDDVQAMIDGKFQLVDSFGGRVKRK
jgi:hypothetical protein